MTRFICIFFSLIAYRERESVISRDAVQQSKCSGTSQECKPACRRSSRANKFAGSLNQAVNVTWQNHDDMMKTESLSKIRPDEADRTIKSINKPPRDSVKSKYTFAYYHDRDRRKCKWQDSAWWVGSVCYGVSWAWKCGLQKGRSNSPTQCPLSTHLGEMQNQALWQRQHLFYYNSVFSYSVRSGEVTGSASRAIGASGQ